MKSGFGFLILLLLIILVVLVFVMGIPGLNIPDIQFDLGVGAIGEGLSELFQGIVKSIKF